MSVVLPIVFQGCMALVHGKFGVSANVQEGPSGELRFVPFNHKLSKLDIRLPQLRMRRVGDAIEYRKEARQVTKR
jgi:hypothetical protein